ncbi:MAG: ABC transporter substrate-binding protein, partial [Actinobacteria bacterium]|nr:ABC transporter substrate-binding protein [Actinomycetota bacterium]
MADRIRLSLYCPTSLPGYHLPFLAAGANGLFAKFDLDVEILEPAPGPANAERVALGGADVCLTSVPHYLAARTRSGDLAARFFSILVRRSPLAGLVADGSDMAAPADLPGRRIGAPEGGELLAEYQTGLAHLGLGPSQPVPMTYEEAPAALGRGEIEVVADFADLLPRTRRQAGIPLRAVPLCVE